MSLDAPGVQVRPLVPSGCAGSLSPVKRAVQRCSSEACRIFGDTVPRRDLALHREQLSVAKGSAEMQRGL